MRRARVGITKGAKPIGSLLFMGPTGVGKTETAKALAEGYFGNENRMIRFDMSEYQGEDALDRVIGSLGTNEPGAFAKTIREKPFSLLLLDEIEKSHPNILNLFLVMIDEGYFTDAFGKKVDCRNLIIIGTSNAGTELIREKLSQKHDPGSKKKTIQDRENMDKLEREVVDYVQRKGIFSPEFINRFDAVVIYRPLTHENLLEIAKLMLANLNKRLKKKDLSIKITDKLLEKVVKLGYDPAFGARPMNRVIQDKIEDQIAQKLLRGELRKGEEVEIEI
jgi:ATP-dependent Clp protease ATP-binding subunit ClpC